MKKILAISALLLMTIVSWSQINDLYFNKNIYQSTQLNPARQHKCKVTIGLPVISSMYFDFKNSGVTYAKMFYEDANKPKDKRFVIDAEGFYKTLDKTNYIFLHNKVNLLSFSFWVKDFYISFDADLKVEQNFLYPKSMFDLKDGNYFDDPNKYISFSNMNENLNVYSSYGLGVSKEIIPGLTIGAKFKLLNGIANVTTNKFQFDWHVADTDTSTYDYTFKGDIDMNTSVPFKIHPVYDENGHISDIKTEAEQYFEDIEEDPALIKDLFRQENTGFAVDLGFIYNINKKIEISGSILDLGYINWKTNAMNIYAKEFQYNFSGVDISKYVNDLEIAQNLSDKEARDSILENIKDDILDTVFALTDPTFDSTITSYNKRLNSKIYLGFSYSPTNWFTLGLLYNGYIYNKKLFSNYAVSGTLLFWKGWSYTLSYTVFKHSYNNIGMGLSYKVGPFQMYLMMNNIAVPFFAGRYAMYPDKPYDEGIATKWVKNSRWLNLQFGINFTFGCKDQRDYGLLD